MDGVAAVPNSSPELEPAPQLESLRGILERAAGLLPIPGPITAFAFLNTLQALEDLPFDVGLRLGAHHYGAEPYLPEARYRSHLARGRILADDLSATLLELLDEEAGMQLRSLGSRYDLRLTMLQHGIPNAPDEELRWFIAESRALERFHPGTPSPTRERLIEETRHWVLRDLQTATARNSATVDTVRARQILNELLLRFGPSSIEHWNDPDVEWEGLTLQVLWRVCCDGARRGAAAPAPKVPPTPRLRDLVLETTGQDSDVLVDAVLIRFCAAFTDQGLAQTQLPNRDQGFLRAFIGLHRTPATCGPRWLRGLSTTLQRWENEQVDALHAVRESLEALGIAERDWDGYVTATLLALRGWAGLLWQMETRSDRFPVPAPSGSLLEFLAVRLLLDRLAVEYLSHEYESPTTSCAALWADRRRAVSPLQTPSVVQRALSVFQLAQLRGWNPQDLNRLTDREWEQVIAEIETFDEIERRRVFHLAFERRLQVQAFDAFAFNSRREPPRPRRPEFQVACCIDAREESFRRHLEEVTPNVETFGLAGFFGVPMYYRGAGDAHFAALCPIVMKPRHWVVEDVVYTQGPTHRRRARTRRALGTATHRFQVATHSPAIGAFLSTTVGVLASIPLTGRVLFPRLTARIRHSVSSLIKPPPSTRLRLERTSKPAGPEDGQIGFSLEEMAEIGERVLRDIGLTSNFAPLVIFLGHGASALNNPHKSAYDCGACSGSPGGPNARALAAMLNDTQVRNRLWQRGLSIPNDTIFVGGQHNTTTDTITFFDLDTLRSTHFREFDEAVDALQEACRRNAHERCRRFDSAPVNLSTAAAHQHVEGRSEDLAQTRPEFGNATNAFCFVGRRQRTRGLFLDRRCFLASYDPSQDDAECTVLTRILSAVVPVCEGINLQYFLSAVDTTGWSCGSKLPHNVASLVGVMDGAASDLRPGLPWQGVEIHEPVRLTFIVETTAESMLRMLERQPAIRRILGNGWAHLAVIDPDSSALQIYQHGSFRPYFPTAVSLPCAASSRAWYQGWRDHLRFAAINLPGEDDSPPPDYEGNHEATCSNSPEATSHRSDSGE